MLPVRGIVIAAAFSVFALQAHADSGCRGVTCSNAGTCFAEEGVGYCLCDEGRVAQGHECIVPDIAVTSAPPIGEDIARLARAELGRDLRALGSDDPRASPPLVDALRHYVAEDSLWCSDFVAWVYARSGSPLSGGYAGGWHIPTNRAIRAWFTRRGRWISRVDANRSGFSPIPGDFVRIRTARWGHSAIIERVEGDTLHVLEGNAGGRVHANRYQHWRRHPKIGGFGLMENARERMEWKPPVGPRLLGALTRT